MNTTLQGESYEDKVYAYFSSLLDNDILPFAPKGQFKTSVESHPSQR